MGQIIEPNTPNPGMVEPDDPAKDPQPDGIKPIKPPTE